MRNLKDCKKWLVAVLAAAILITDILPVQAEHMSPLKKEVLEVTKMIEALLEKQYQMKKEELENRILKSGYDYALTMENFYDNGNPFADIDYLELIAIYSTIKEYKIGKGMELEKGLSQINFLTMELNEMDMEESIPVLTENYVEKEEGIYIRDGNRVIKEEELVGKFEDAGDGTFIMVGKKTVVPKISLVTYADVKLSYIGNEALYEAFSVEKEKVEEAMNEKLQILKNEINGKTLTQSVFVQIPQGISLPEEIQSLVLKSISEQEGIRKQILENAVSLIGRVPYQWGGKASAAGYDTSWWLYDESGKQKGLDCSGFVQWAYMTSGVNKKITDTLISTNAMLSLEEITYDELKPGDIGLLNRGETTNHAGIYIGDGYFIHCSSEQKTVTVNQFPFRYFKKVQIEDKNNLTESENVHYPIIEYTNSVQEELIYQNVFQNDVVNTDHESDVYLLAQLIYHEAGNQGYNGKVAVGEVVINRKKNPKIDEKTIRDVIYEEGQFSGVEEIRSIVPDEETLSIARLLLEGKISIFNNIDVLFFRNPKITSGIAPETKADWGKYKWYTSVNEHAFYIL